MVSEFGATPGCKACLVVGQPHTKECRARITTGIEDDPRHVERGWNSPIQPEVAAPSESRTTTPKRARQDDVGPPQESATTGEFSSSASGNDVEMRSISTGKRPLEPGGDDDIVCELDVCDELHEYSADTYVNDCERDYTDEVTGVTLLRDDAAKTRTEEMTWYE